MYRKTATILALTLLLFSLTYYAFAAAVTKVNNPLSHNNVGGTVIFSATVTNESVENVTFRGINISLNSSGELVFFGANTTSPNNTEYNVSIDTSTLPSGVYTLNVTATNRTQSGANSNDTTGSNASQTNITIDNSRPNVTIGSISNFQNLTATGGAYNSTDDLNLTYNVSDVFSGQLNCSIYQNSVITFSSVHNNNTATLRERTVVDLGNGNFLFNVTCVDIAGNEGSQTKNITTDTSTVNTTEIAYADADGVSITTATIEYNDKIKITCRNTTADNLNFNLTTNISVKRPTQTTFEPVGEFSPFTYTTTTEIGRYVVMCNLTDSTGNVNSTNKTFDVERKISTSNYVPAGEETIGKKVITSGSYSNVGELSDASESRLMAKTASMKFTLKGEEHSLYLKDLGEDSATFTLQSEPQDVTLNVGETGNYDVDNDGKNDVAVTLNGISRGRADVTVAGLKASTAEETTESGKTTTTTGEKEKKSSLLLWLIILLIVVLILIWFFKKKSSGKVSFTRKDLGGNQGSLPPYQGNYVQPRQPQFSPSNNDPFRYQ